jgi:hypothetical protein
VSEISETIDAVIEPLRPLMKQHGFAKSGRTWRRRRDACVHLVNVQANKWNSAAEGSFTVNLAVYFPVLAEIVGTFPVRQTPAEMDCQLRERIGFLMPGANDFWWEVRPGSPMLQIADEVVSAVKTLGLPWLEAHATLEAVLASAGTPGYRLSDVDAAAICIALGRWNEARDWLGRIRDHFLAMGRPGVAERWLAWGRERGVVVA